MTYAAPDAVETIEAALRSCRSDAAALTFPIAAEFSPPRRGLCGEGLLSNMVLAAEVCFGTKDLITVSQPFNASFMPKRTSAVASHFVKASPSVQSTYDAVLEAARSLGPVIEDAKKTSIHLVREKAFAGVAVRRSSLTLTLKATRAIKSRRVRRAEQASANRWHLEIPLVSPEEVDGELRGWLAAAYELGE